MEVEATAKAVARQLPCVCCARVLAETAPHLQFGSASAHSSNCEPVYCVDCSCAECVEGRSSGIRLPPGRLAATDGPSLVSDEDLARWRASIAAKSLPKLREKLRSWQLHYTSLGLLDGNMREFAKNLCDDLKDAISKCEALLEKAEQTLPSAREKKRKDATRQASLPCDLSYRPSPEAEERERERLARLVPWEESA